MGYNGLLFLQEYYDQDEYYMMSIGSSGEEMCRVLFLVFCDQAVYPHDQVCCKG